MTQHASRQEHYDSYRNSYQTFFFEDFSIQRSAQSLDVQYQFSVDRKVRFQPTFSIPWREDYQELSVDDERLRNLVFHIGMVEVISYWKAICPPQLVVEVAQLDKTQIAFWKKLYFNGLGEFFYLNGIQATQDDFMHISSTSEKCFVPFAAPDLKGVIIPVGGGKDSVVTLELLKTKQDARAMIVNPRGASLKTAEASGFSDEKVYVIKRRIDPALLLLNKEGYLNGHTPFSSLLAFQSVLLALLSGRKEIALSNEGSANEATVIGTHVNHQYSKSFEFEADFRNYVANYLTRDISYFSFLRPLSELQIACLFSSFTHQHEHFRSCNVGSKEDQWCGNCPKCLFTYIILSPFLSLFELEQIFGEDLLNKESLLKDFDELAGIAEVKPFECVGTVDEVNTGLCYARHNYPDNQLPFLLQHFAERKGFEPCEKQDLNYLLTHFEEEHYLSEELLALLRIRLEHYATEN